MTPPIADQITAVQCIAKLIRGIPLMHSLTFKLTPAFNSSLLCPTIPLLPCLQLKPGWWLPVLWPLTSLLLPGCQDSPILLWGTAGDEPGGFVPSGHGVMDTGAGMSPGGEEGTTQRDPLISSLLAVATCSHLWLPADIKHLKKIYFIEWETRRGSPVDRRLSAAEAPPILGGG